MSSDKQDILDNLQKKKLESEEKYEQLLSEQLEVYETKCDALREEKEYEEIQLTSQIQVLKTKQKGLNAKLRSKLKMEEKKHKEKCKELQRERVMDKEYYDTFITQCIKSHAAAALPDEAEDPNN